MTKWGNAVLLESPPTEEKKLELARYFESAASRAGIKNPTIVFGEDAVTAYQWEKGWDSQRPGAYPCGWYGND